MRKIKTMMGAAVLAVATLSQTACGSSSTPESVAVEYTKLMYAGQYDKAMALIDTRALGDEEKKALASTLGSFMTPLIEQSKNFGGFKSAEALGKAGTCAKSGETCRIFVLNVFGDGKRDKIETGVINVDGDYKVLLNQ